MSVEKGQKIDKLDIGECAVVDSAGGFHCDSVYDEGCSLKNTVKVGTRGSKLALAQTELVIKALKERFPQVDFQMATMSTRGDRDTSRALLEFGGKAVFVEEFEEAILKGDIDIAVHSAKDMPMEVMDGLTIAGTLPRACPQDVLIYKSGRTFDRNDSFVVGTSSLRRQYQIREIYPNAGCKNLRGNVGTRIQKLKDGEYDAIILAAAGLERLGIIDGSVGCLEVHKDELTFRYLSTESMLPAACQGIIAIETRTSGEACDMVREINDTEAYTQLICERAVLNRLNAGCHEPIGVYSELDGGHMKLSLMKAEETLVETETDPDEHSNSRNEVASQKTIKASAENLGKKKVVEIQIHRNTVEGNTADWAQLVEALVK